MSARAGAPTSAPYAVVLFDLDGTITDPQAGITGCVAHALADAGIVVDDLTSLRGYIGPPLRDGFARFHGLAGPHGERAVAVYRERYLAEGIFDLEVVAGMPELLTELHEAGVVVAVATSKATSMAESIVDHLGLTGVIAFVGGATLDGSRGTKSEIIAHTLIALTEQGVMLVDDGGVPARVAMVGDRHHDIDGAHAPSVANHDLTAIGVRWGFAEPDELEQAGADLVVADVGALRRALLGAA